LGPSVPKMRKPQSAVWRGKWGRDDLMSGKGKERGVFVVEMDEQGEAIFGQS
jgi:hypothetical protein